MKKLYFTLVIAMISFGTKMYSQDTWYVNDASTSGDIYTTAAGNNATNAANDPSKPSLTIGDALTAAVAGDVIYVDSGSYTGTGNQTLALDKEITIIGAGTGKTIITGSGDNRFGIVSANNVIIQNLQFFEFIYSSGAGQVFYVNSSVSNFRLNNIVMSRNNGSSNGGDSITLLSGSSSTFNGLFFSCSGYNGGSGGGIKVNSATLNINNSVFSQSRDADGRGGAIEILGTSVVTIDNSSFDGNSARAGGAISQTGGTLTVTNTCFNRNYVQGDTSNSSNGGGHYYTTGTIVSASFTNCKFEGAFFCAASSPDGYLCSAYSNGSNDGNGLNLKGSSGTFVFDTCIFSNSNQPAANFDNGLDLNLDKAGTISVTINNSSFGNDMYGGVGSGGSDAVNIFNQDLSNTEFIVTNSGTPQTAANQDGIDGNNFSYSGTAPGGNTSTQTSANTVVCLGQITGCSISVNCATETKAPVITQCVENKTILDCSGTLPDYTSEVSAFDDCSFTVTQSPAPGTSLASLGSGTHTITITVSDESPNSDDATCTFTLTLSDCPITCSDSTTWSGTWSNGEPTETKSAIFTTNYTAVANIAACSVTISDNAVVTIPSGFDCTVSTDITVNAGSSFVFENTANLLQLSATATNTGNITMTRNTNPLFRLDYTGWSSPVSGQNLLSFSPNTLTNRFYFFNPEIMLFSRVAAPASTNFDTGVGYLIRTPNTHPTTPATVFNGVFEGVPNNGDYTISLGNFGVGNRINLVGNPYPSPIDMATFVADNSANITGTLYFWRKTNSTSTENVWSTWNNGVYTAADEPYTSDPQGMIRNGQGFLVEALGAATTLVFNNGMRVGDNQNLFFRTANRTVNNNEDSRIWLNLTNSNGEFYQQAISYTSGGTNSVDNFDAKNFSNATTMLNSLIPNSTDYYVIQSRSLPFSVEDVIPLSLSVGVSGEYTISIFKKDGVFLDPNQPVYLTDNYLNTCVNLNDGLYTFTSDTGNFDNRFELRYTNSLLSSNDNTFLDNDVNVYVNKDKQLIVNSNRLIYTVSVYDVLGKLHIFEKANNSNEVAIDISSISNQLLLVKITDANGMVVSKKIIK